MWGGYMSWFDYKASQMISREDPPFYALIMAAMRKADTVNLQRLEKTFPDTAKELRERYSAPDGKLPHEQLLP